MDDLVGAVKYATVVAISDAVRQLSAEAVSRTAGQTVGLLQMFEQGIGADDRQPIWQQVAADAQESVARSYVQTRRQGGPVGYRTTATNPANVRDAGGRMYAAIRSPGFVRVDGDRIMFANTKVMDRYARQWWRLNFGAQPEAGNRPGQWPVRWSNMVLGSFGLDGAPSPAFDIPSGAGRRGYWTAIGRPKRYREFHPAGEGPAFDGAGDSGPYRWVRKRGTRGIKARNFLDAGVRYIADEAPDSFRQMYVTAWRDAETRAAATSAGIRVVKPTRPPSRSPRYRR